MKLEKNFRSPFNNQRDFLLSHLLPYDPNNNKAKKLENGLREYLLLIIAAEQALEIVAKKDINRFDPLVGENACQIRSLQIALIFLRYPVDSQALLSEISRVRIHCLNLIENLDRIVNKRSISDLFKSDIEIHLNFSEYFLIQSYLLTKVKISKPPSKENPLVLNEYTDIKKIGEISHIGSNFTNKLVSHLRQSLSVHSVELIQSLAYQLEMDQTVKQIISADFVIIHRHLKCLPCFWVCKVIIQAAIKYKIPIVLHAQLKSQDRNYQIENEIFLYFDATLTGYQNVPLISLKKETPAIVLIGSTARDFNNLPSVHDWKKELIASGPIDIFLACAATHKQYPNEMAGEEIYKDQIQNKEFQFYRKKAFEWGCCLQNASRFFWSHVYCDSIENISLSSFETADNS
ncbi:hypothetical protein TrispH2_009042 [Trichoplax sp. H2]|nr:hypothetical protein TrispH2_009042 [Trichoplax sp. H2]|eukprot:RDD39349.1 hypothetical protein TrispH2_009042 [Trichoplax sp. H2]